MHEVTTETEVKIHLRSSKFVTSISSTEDKIEPGLLGLKTVRAQVHFVGLLAGFEVMPHDMSILTFLRAC